MPSSNEQVVYSDGRVSLTLFPSNTSIAILTVSQDATFNAQNLVMLQSLHYALHTVIPSLSPALRVLILTAEGTRRFIGAEQPEMLIAADRAADEEASRLGQENAKALEEMPAITIAAVNGTAIGGGCGMVLACDFAVAVKTARFAQVEVLGGVIPGFGGTYWLPRAIGRGRARWMLFHGAGD